MKGWIKSIRKSKGITFVATTDGKRDHQLTIKDGECQIIGELKVGASFISEGYQSVTPKGFDEFVSTKLTIIGESDDDYPIQPKRHSHEFLRSIPELRGRTKMFQSVWRIRHHITQELHRFLSDSDFIQYFTPIITQSDCEGAGDTFDVKSDWMHEKLTVSGQLHGEVGMMSLGQIYTLGPCFRAEKSSTKKHLSEFWMLEPEMAFYSLEDTIDFSEKMLKFVMTEVIKKVEDFQRLEIDMDHMEAIVKEDWIKLTYDEVCKEFGLEFGEDISSEMEKKLIEKYKLPVYVTHWPKDLKPFYMKKDDRVAYCFDLIFPEVGELIGGSQREEDYKTLKDEMEKMHMDMDKMDWYLKTREWGSVPHSGFGLGIERLVMFMTKMPKIHDVIPFPISY